MKKKNTIDHIYELLKTVNDPELGISIVDLGLIYKVTEKDKNIIIDMTLTTIGCPLFPLIETQMKQALKNGGYDDIKINLTFDPAWSLDLVSELGRAHLGI